MVNAEKQKSERRSQDHKSGVRSQESEVNGQQPEMQGRYGRTFCLRPGTPPEEARFSSRTTYHGIRCLPMPTDQLSARALLLPQ
jgi:hypothetical protein